MNTANKKPGRGNDEGAEIVGKQEAETRFDSRKNGWASGLKPETGRGAGEKTEFVGHFREDVDVSRAPVVVADHEARQAVNKNVRFKGEKASAAEIEDEQKRRFSPGTRAAGFLRPFSP